MDLCCLTSKISVYFSFFWASIHPIESVSNFYILLLDATLMTKETLLPKSKQHLIIFSSLHTHIIYMAKESLGFSYWPLKQACYAINISIIHNKEIVEELHKIFKISTPKHVMKYSLSILSAHFFSV